MTIQNAVEKLKSLNQPFDVSLPDETKVASLVSPFTFGEDDFTGTMEEHKVSELHITLRPKRGVVHNIGESFIVTSSKPTPITMDQAQKSGNPINQMDPLVHYMLSAKDEKIMDQQRTISLLENSLKSSENELKALEKKNMELERENKLKDAQFDIERKDWQSSKEREEFAKEREGLNGIVAPVERLATNPAVMEMVKMILASKAAAQPALGPGSDIMPKPHVAHLVKNFNDWMNQQDEKTANNFFNIVAQMSSHPETWPAVKAVLSPQQQAA
jgi:hypothetical protein